MYGLKTGSVQISFIQSHWLHEGRKVGENCHKFFRGFAIPVEVAFDEDSLGAEATGGDKRHTGMQAESTRFI